MEILKPYAFQHPTAIGDTRVQMRFSQKITKIRAQAQTKRFEERMA
jgi:hypothetical protein